jgi:putative selenate reductase molybdopterin-binding subunit
VSQGAAAIAWDRKLDPAWRATRRGRTSAAGWDGRLYARHRHPGLDMGAASIKMNDDGSFNVLVGGTDLGTGSDTVLAQIAAETLGAPLNDIIIYSSDTDFHALRHRRLCILDHLHLWAAP